MGFPLLSFKSLSSALFSPCSLLHPSSFVLLSLHFSFLLCFSSCLHFCLAPVSFSLFPLLIPFSLSSRQIAGLGVMVRCLGRSLVYRVVYTANVFFPCLSLFSFSLDTFLNMCSLCQTCTHSPESLAFLLCLSGVYICVCVCVCVFADRMGFCGETQPPESGREQIGV